MYSSRLVQLFIVALSVLCLARATWQDSVRAAGRALLPTPPPLPSGSSSSVPGSTPSGSSSSSSSTPVSSQATSSTSAAAKSTSSTSTTPTSSSSTSSTHASSTPSSASSTKPASSTSKPATSTTFHSTTSKKTSTTIAKAVVSTSLAVVTSTKSDGQKVTLTTAVKTTSTPGLSNEGDNGTSSMSPKTRSTIIGVVVGIGGAVILGAIAVVGWRIWGRKKYAEEADGLMSYGHAYSGIDKQEQTNSGSPSGNGRTPFQSTLENYHQPSAVNSSANF